MAYIGKPEELSTQPNFLKSATVTAFTTTVKESDDGSEKVVKAGTIYPKNDATAKGSSITMSMFHTATKKHH